MGDTRDALGLVMDIRRFITYGPDITTEDFKSFYVQLQGLLEDIGTGPQSVGGEAMQVVQNEVYGCLEEIEYILEKRGVRILKEEQYWT